jgi:putative ABC transport system permease protein
MAFAFNLFLRFVFRDVRHNWIRTTLTVFGIALGVSVYLAISIANHTAISSFKQTVSQVSGKSNLELMPLSGPTLSETVLMDLAGLTPLGVKYTAMIDEHLVLTPEGLELKGAQALTNQPTGAMGAAGKPAGEIVQLIGIDMLADPDFKSYQSAGDDDDAIDGDINKSTGKLRADDTDSDNPNSLEAKAKKNDDDKLSVFSPAVLVGGKLAERYGIAKGSELTVLVNDRTEKIKVAGVLSPSGLGGAYSGNVIVADIGLAQDLLKWNGQVTRVDLIVPDELLGQVEEKLKEVVPADVMVATPDTRSQQAEKMVRSFEYNLLALTFIALMVGMFLIYNTMTITILRRRPEIGILRAIGVKRGTVQAVFLWEAICLGFTGTTLGVIMGAFLADGALKAVAQTFQYFYFKVPLEKITIDPLQYLAAFGIGMGLTLIAALPPLIEATTVDPAEATRRASQETKVRKSTVPLFLAGLLLLALTYLCALQPAVNDFPLFGYIAALFAIMGSSFLMPLVLAKILPGVGRLLFKIFGVEGRIASASLQGTLGRTAVAAASLMIGIAMMVSLAIMISSFRKTVTHWIDQSFEADLWLQSQARASGNKYGRLQEAVLKEVESVPGVAAAEGFVDRKIDYQGMSAFLAAADFDVLTKYGNQLFLSGESSKVVCGRVRGMRAIISEPFAVRKNLKKGQSVEIDTPQGKRTFLIEDVFYDYASDLGYVIIPRDVYKSLYNDNTISSVAIYLADGASIEQVRQGILGRISKSSLVALSSTSELRKEAIRIFDRTFAITYALHTIAVTVAMLSIMNALFALTIESKREFAILRYVGATRSQLGKIVYIQAGILGACGNFGGIGLGYILSLLLIHVINKQSFGWSVQYFIPYDFIVQSSILVILTSVLSGIYPARIAARTLAPSVVRDQ